MENIDKIIYVLVTSGVSLLTYFMGKRKRDVEIENVQLSNMEKSLGIYQRMIDDMSKKIDEMSAKIDELERTIESLYKENKQLKSKIK